MDSKPVPAFDMDEFWKALDPESVEFYDGPNAVTATEMANRNEHLSRSAADRQAKKAVALGRLVEVTVTRFDSMKRLYKVAAYVLPDEYEEWRKARDQG